MLLAASFVNAKPTDLDIQQVQVDLDQGYLYVYGESFGNSSSLVVSIGSQQVGFDLGTATDSYVEVFLPAGILDGSYSLTFRNGNGPKKADEFEFSVGTVGPPGVAGPAGPEGPQGEQGPAGVAGVAGPAGPEGPQGEQGLAGVAGPVGPEGPQGQQGPAGVAGPVGPEGPQGEQGPAGVAGPVGPEGPQGEQGPAGVAGPAGPEGPQGEQGSAGVAGPVGPGGPQGEQGPAGVAGPAGPVGPQGEQGPVGLAGPIGPKGPQGEQGPVGLAGPAGPVGPQGLSCWDLDSDSIKDPEEDLNSDGVVDVLDCQGSFAGGSFLAQTNGYVDLPGGLTLQWGRSQPTDKIENRINSVSFPKNFTSGVYSVQVSWQSPSFMSGDSTFGLKVHNPPTTSGFTYSFDLVSGPVPSGEVYWMAIGK